MRRMTMLISLWSAGCLVGSGRLEERTLPLAGFEGIDAADGFAVEVVRGDSFSVRVAADDNVWPEVDARLVGRSLRLALAESRPYGGLTLRARVTMPSLSALAVSGGARAQLEGFDEERVVLLASGGASLSGLLDAETLELTLSGGSVATLNGGGRSLMLAASGASRARLNGFPVAFAGVEASGASEASVTVSQRIDYRVSGGSRLVIHGHPAVGSSEVSGGAEATEW